MRKELQNALQEQAYVSLTTYRKNGQGVATPVWFAPALGGVCVWTRADSWKVKRIGNNPQVEVAPCTARGKVTGAAVKAVARALNPDEVKTAERALAAKYGVQYTGGRFFSKLLGREAAFLLIS